jgi:hypothetical protein
VDLQICVQGREKNGGEYADMIPIPSSGCIHIQRDYPGDSRSRCQASVVEKLRAAWVKQTSPRSSTPSHKCCVTRSIC